MADGTVRAWAQELLERDLEAFVAARRRFLRRPTGKRLHAVRTTSRRLRSLLEDFSTVIATPDLHELRRAIHASGTARDAALLEKIVHDALVHEERAYAQDYLHALRKRKHVFWNKTCTRLQRIHLELV